MYVYFTDIGSEIR